MNVSALRARVKLVHCIFSVDLHNRDDSAVVGGTSTTIMSVVVLCFAGYAMPPVRRCIGPRTLNGQHGVIQYTLAILYIVT